MFEKLTLTMTVEEAAKVLGVGRNTAYGLAAQNKLPGVRRLGRRIVVSRKALDDFLAGSADAMYSTAQDNERRTERLTIIIKGWLEDGCPLDATGDAECNDPARHLAEEIVDRGNAWL